MFMSNDARKIMRFLASKFGGRPEPDVDEIVALEQSILAYYPNPIINVMDDMISRAKPEKLDNYANFTYHLPGLRRITSKRSKNPRKLIGWESFRETLIIFNKLLVVDYNHDTLLLLIDIADGIDQHKWNQLTIRKAIETAIQAGVRSVQYVNAIVQREYAERQATLQRAREIVDSAQPAEVGPAQHGMNFIEQMSAEAMWNERKENSDIERRLKKIVDGGVLS
jgi:hypothetical protein